MTIEEKRKLMDTLQVMLMADDLRCDVDTVNCVDDEDFDIALGNAVDSCEKLREVLIELHTRVTGIPYGGY